MKNFLSLFDQEGTTLGRSWQPLKTRAATGVSRLPAPTGLSPPNTTLVVTTVVTRFWWHLYGS